jgi:hypothetical protein
MGAAPLLALMPPAPDWYQCAPVAGRGSRRPQLTCTRPSVPPVQQSADLPHRRACAQHMRLDFADLPCADGVAPRGQERRGLS